MSLDIDWSLLTSSSDPSGSSLSSNLITTLNAHLASTSRPSFIGPISIAAFDFGSTGPEVEIRDIRDVWRAFDDDEDEEEYGDEEDEDDWGRGTREQSFDSFEGNGFQPVQPRHGPGGGQKDWRGEVGDEEEYEMLEEEDFDDNVSVYSGMSPRYAVAALGVGMGFGLGAGTPSARQLGYRPHPIPSSNPLMRSRSISQSLFSPPPPPSARPLPLQPPPARRRPRPTSIMTHQMPLHSPPSSLPASPPVHPPSSTGGAPSLQLHLHLSHTSNLTLTLLTSLQVNYPSSLFMSLPLRLCVTGLSVEADVVLAYANTSDGDSGPTTEGRSGRRRGKGGGGGRGKVHLCLTDEDPSSSTPVGQRIIPHVQIESEIGDGDVHVLRNVGKVERFIVEALRKTVVDELVFPNFHTVVL